MFLELKSKWKDVKSRKILSLIDRQRVNNFSIQTNGLFFDYSKTNIDEDTLGLLLDLLKKSSFHEKFMSYIRSDRGHSPLYFSSMKIQGRENL